MHRNQSIDLHQFAMIPRADIPRASFRMQKTLKTTFDAGFLVPVFCEEVLPGDMFKLSMTAFARLATPIFPIMDNLHFECFWFFVPNRLVWLNWQRFMGERSNPNDSISYTIPQLVSPPSGYPLNSLGDYFGLPTVGQVDIGRTVTHSALPFRGYNLIYQEWFKDQNLINQPYLNFNDGPDESSGLPGPGHIDVYTLLRRGKRHDYFTSCLPFLQKGNAPSLFPTSVPIKSDGNFPLFSIAGGITDSPIVGNILNTTVTTALGPGLVGGNMKFGTQTGLFGDLSAPGVVNTINQLRQAFQIQKLLERDARGGTRYTEIVRSHFGVMSPDARLQRPEYLGGGSVPIAVNPVAQTSATTVTGGDTPQGNLAAIGTTLLRSNFTQSFTEHGYIMGMVNVRADLTYQQGLRRHWSRLTRYDYYFPVFAMLGEQAVLRKEIFATGEPSNDNAIFGYQERWAEYRYLQSEICGLFRSTAAQPIDQWHLAERFAVAPTLGINFIEDQTDTILERVLAVGDDAGGQQLICDVFFDCMATRPMPLYSVPGMIDHF